jgi:hypothetical protein
MQYNLWVSTYISFKIVVTVDLILLITFFKHQGLGFGFRNVEADTSIAYPE